MARRIVTAREQVEMLSPWRREALIKEARYPQEWSGKAPYGYLPSGRARNRPPSVRRDPDDPNSEVIDPSEIRYEDYGDSVSAFHPNGEHLGNYSWEDDGGHAHIGIAIVDPKYQGQGVAGGIIDHIRERHRPNLVHSGYQGNGTLSYQGRAGALRDLGNTEEEHNDYFNTTPYNYGESQPSQFSLRNPSGGRKVTEKTDAQQRAHDELVQQFEEDKNHPNFTGVRSRLTRDENMYDEYGDRHEYGYDTDGNYVGLQDGIKDSDGYSEEGYDREGYNRDGLNSSGADREGRDEYGFHQETGLNRDGKTRHGYTPGGGQPPEGTVSMSRMQDHWEQNGLVPSAVGQQGMMDEAVNGLSPAMYAVRHPNEISPHTGSHHVGNGDTLYSSLERARQMAYHPDDPSKDKNIVSVDYGTLDPRELHTDASGKTPEDFHYAPVSGWDDSEDTASTPADLVHDPQRHQRVLSDLGHGWKQSTESPFAENSGFDYTDPNSGRSGRMYHMGNGTWATQHQPEFGRRRQNRYDNHREAADAIRQGTAPGPTMEHHAMEVNNNYEATGQGSVDWEPHPNGQGLMARTPHGDLHLNRDPDSGEWNWHAGPHGYQPGDEGGMKATFTESLNRAAATGIMAITRSPFHGGLGDELGKGWQRHPSSGSSYTQRMPSGNHAFMRKNDDGTYNSGIQLDNGRGLPYGRPIATRDSPNISEAKEFINHRDSPVPANNLGKGWENYDLGIRHFPAYLHRNHPSGATARVVRASDGGWRGGVDHGEESYRSSEHGTPGYKTPHEAAAWANKVMDEIGNNKL
jgi:GNAT superfamily N-acetyltransferase